MDLLQWSPYPPLSSPLKDLEFAYPMTNQLLAKLNTHEHEEHRDLGEYQQHPVTGTITSSRALATG